MALTKLKEAKILAEKYNRIKTDLDRIKFIKGNNDALGVALDNDHTHAVFLLDGNLQDEEKDLFYDIELNSFDHFCGSDDLTFLLWKSLGIEAECV